MASARRADHLAGVLLDVAVVQLHGDDHHVAEGVEGALQGLHGLCDAGRPSRHAEDGLLVAVEDVLAQRGVPWRVRRDVVDLQQVVYKGQSNIYALRLKRSSREWYKNCLEILT